MTTNFQNEELKAIRIVAEKGRDRSGKEYHLKGCFDLILYHLDKIERINNDNKAQDSIAGY